MASHVNGLTTLGDLRQSILAVVVGNKRFTDEEQLRINHSAHEYEGHEELTRWLRELRQEDAHRAYVARLRAVRSLPAPGLGLDADTQDGELLYLVACPSLGQTQKASLLSLFAFDAIGPTGRLRLLGDAYARVLGARASVEPYCGLEGIYEN